MGQIIDFNLRKGNLSNITLYSISRDNIFKGILQNVNTSKINNYNDLDNYKFIELEKRLNNITDSKFRDRVFSILQLIRDYTDKKDLTINKDTAIGFLNGKDYLLLSVKDKNIEYAIENEEEANYGKLKHYKDKCIINYNGINKSFLYDLNRKSKRMTIINSLDTSIYDSMGFVLSTKNKTITNNYDMFIENGEEYSVPDKFNNCTTIKLNRVGNNILKNIKVQYLNKEYNGIIDKDTINKDDYYVGFNYNSNSKTIPEDIYYQEIDYEDYLNMKRGR